MREDLLKQIRVSILRFSSDDYLNVGVHFYMVLRVVCEFSRVKRPQAV